MSGAPALFLESQLFKIFSYPANMFCQEAGKHFSNFPHSPKENMRLSPFSTEAQLDLLHRYIMLQRKALQSPFVCLLNPSTILQ